MKEWGVLPHSKNSDRSSFTMGRVSPMYVFTQPLRRGEDMTQGKTLNGVRLV